MNGHIWLQVNTVDVRRAGNNSISDQTSGYVDPDVLLGR